MKNIILVGYMGCGKTTVGKSIAEITKYIFADTDEMIVARQGRSINDIFGQDGEPAFRDMETALLAKMLADKTDTHVISTGGGMPVRDKNRQLLRQLGTVVYLRVKPETVYERIKGDTTRPLLQCENPMERIREMIEKRSPAYEAAAELVIDVDSMTQWEAAEEIIKRTEERGSVIE